MRLCGITFFKKLKTQFLQSRETIFIDISRQLIGLDLSGSRLRYFQWDCQGVR
jgi:hypothetical protein